MAGIVSAEIVAVIMLLWRSLQPRAAPPPVGRCPAQQRSLSSALELIPPPGRDGHGRTETTGNPLSQSASIAIDGQWVRAIGDQLAVRSRRAGSVSRWAGSVAGRTALSTSAPTTINLVASPRKRLVAATAADRDESVGLRPRTAVVILSECVPVRAMFHCLASSARPSCQRPTAHPGPVRDARQSPPDTSVTSRSKTTLDGSWTAKDLRQPKSANDIAAPKPVAAIISVNSTPRPEPPPQSSSCRPGYADRTR